MAKMPIDVAIIGNSSKGVEQALTIANAAQDEYVFSRLDAAEERQFTLLAFKDVKWEDFRRQLAEFREKIRGYYPFLLVIVDAPLRGGGWTNLFSQSSDKEGLGVLTTYDVEGNIVPAGKLASYVL